jgi:type IV pilus assembly protein PilA
MIQKLRSNQKGFTLIELMIVIAIIGILAAIAVPQFMAYRLRSWNTAAKSIVHNMKADEANLNSELGVYGHTEQAATTLTAADAGVAAADTSVITALAVPATSATNGARLVGTTTADPISGNTRTLAIQISLGRSMVCLVDDVNNANDDSTFHAFARHYKADTAYAVDNDIENVIYSVSNPTWPNLAGLQATSIAAAWPPAEDIGGAAGGGVPTATWERLR